MLLIGCLTWQRASVLQSERHCWCQEVKGHIGVNRLGTIHLKINLKRENTYSVKDMDTLTWKLKTKAVLLLLPVWVYNSVVILLLLPYFQDDLIEREKASYTISGGCCALAAIHLMGKLYVANAGDSRWALWEVLAELRPPGFTL